jgi:hypothetical protein
LLSTLRTPHRNFDALANPGGLGRRNRRQPLVLGLLTGLTTFGLVSQSLVVKEDLFARSPDEVLTTIDTFYRAILKLGLDGGLTPLAIQFACNFRVCHDQLASSARTRRRSKTIGERQSANTYFLSKPGGR